MRCLVSGGSGFIGSHLVDALLQKGHEVRVFDNFFTGKPENIAHVRNDIELVEADLRDYDVVERAIQGCEIVFHQGAIPSVPRSIDNPSATNDVNITGTLNVLRAAHKHSVQRVVVASSSSIYGNAPTLPKVETMPPLPRSPYAISKLATELYTCNFYDVYGLETVALRYFNIFGPRQDPTSQYAGVIAKFARCALRGEPYPMNGDGSSSRDFTYVANAIHANLLAAEAPQVAGEVFNVACGSQIRLTDLTHALNEITGNDVPTVNYPNRKGDVTHSLADIHKAQTMLGYQPIVDFYDGLGRTVEWYQSQPL